MIAICSTMRATRRALLLLALGASACARQPAPASVPAPAGADRTATGSASAGSAVGGSQAVPAAAAASTSARPIAPVAIPQLERERPEAVRMLLGALAADSMEGRATGARGSERAARLIASRMAQAGLMPAGDSGFFQRVPLRVAAPPAGGRPRASAVRSWAHYNALPAAERTIGVNVVGILPGTDSLLRTEAILVDAHYDHLGIGRPVNGDSIYNGADDDGSGTVTVMEVARIIAAHGGNKRTIIFAATTGEEVGLIGTNWYIAYPPFPLAQTVANFEIEMIGRPDSLSGGSGKGWLTGYNFSTMGPMLAASGIPVVADPRPDQNFFQRSDNIAFARLGMVAHTWSSFNLHGDYHEVTDDVGKVDFDHMAKLIDAAAQAVWVLASGPAPTWIPGSQPVGRPPRPVVPPARPPE